MHFTILPLLILLDDLVALTACVDFFHKSPAMEEPSFSPLEDRCDYSARIDGRLRYTYICIIKIRTHHDFGAL